MKKGFTLIELLVVVLIIGILAAIALPQYTKAVERSRSAEAVQALGDLATAQSIYYMQNNEFATALSTGTKALNDGDITVPDPAATNKWKDIEFAATTSDATKGGIGESMTIERDGGMYSGAKLTIAVYPNGAITKTCTEGSTDGFCALVSAAGYTKQFKICNNKTPADIGGGF